MENRKNQLESFWKQQVITKVSYEEVVSVCEQYRKSQRKIDFILVGLFVSTIVVFGLGFFFYHRQQWRESMGLIVMSFAMLLYVFQHFWSKKQKNALFKKSNHCEVTDWLVEEKKRLRYLSSIGMTTYITLMGLGIGLHLFFSTQGWIGDKGRLAMYTFLLGFVFVNYYWNYKVWLKKDRFLGKLQQQLKEE